MPENPLPPDSADPKVRDNPRQSAESIAMESTDRVRGQTVGRIRLSSMNLAVFFDPKHELVPINVARNTLEANHGRE